jgi:Biotin carboxylase, N-terminal domain
MNIWPLAGEGVVRRSLMSWIDIEGVSSVALALHGKGSKAMTNANFSHDPLGHIDRDSHVERRFERIAILTSGEAAMRLIRAVHELNREQRLRLSTVALFTEPDRQALFVREAFRKESEAHEQ